MALITRQVAETLQVGQWLYHVTSKRANGEAVRVQVNGRCKTWKTRPDEFRLPVKYGLKDCFYITPSNADMWSTER